MSQLVLRWFLKAGGDRPDWIYRSEYVANSAVLTARIRTLQDHQQRVLGLGIENFLHAVDLGDIGHHFYPATTAGRTAWRPCSPQPTAIAATRPRLAKHIVCGKRHYPPYSERVEGRLLAPGGTPGTEIDQPLDGRDFFASLYRALSGFGRRSHICRARISFDRELAA